MFLNAILSTLGRDSRKCEIWNNGIAPWFVPTFIRLGWLGLGLFPLALLQIQAPRKINFSGVCSLFPLFRYSAFSGVPIEKPRHYGTYNIQDDLMPTSDSFKDLGVIIDDELKFHAQALSLGYHP